MLKDSITSRLLIRVSITALRAIAPLSIVYCTSRLLGWKPPIPVAVTTLVDIYAASESIFCLLIYIPRRWWLNRPAPEFLPAQLATREKRRTLFLRTWESTPDPHGYVALWFKGVSIDQLRREDILDWLSWRVFNKTTRSSDDDDELCEYLDHVEKVLDYHFPPGRSGSESMAVTFEPVRMMHRPLFWYLCIIGAVELQMATCMRWYGYRFHNFNLWRQLHTLPLRPFSLFLNSKSPSAKMSYWHLKHTSAKHDPILFIHGIGVGLHFYLDFAKKLRALNKTHGIGVIFLEVLPISSRITDPILRREEMTGEILKILQYHNWSRTVVTSHSYGSVIATHLLRNNTTSAMVGPLIFVDPVAFSFHSPQVPWNFLRRHPRSASEIQLQYFASMDADVAHTLTRRFIWPDNSLWREDIEEHAGKCTVAISGRDIIVDTNTLGSYLTRDRSNDHEIPWYKQDDKFNDTWKEEDWTGKDKLEVVYFEECNHAEIFEDDKHQDLLVKVIENYALH